MQEMTAGVTDNLYNHRDFILRIPALERCHFILLFLIHHHWSDNVGPSLIYFHVGCRFITDGTESLITTDFTYQLGVCLGFHLYPQDEY